MSRFYSVIKILLLYWHTLKHVKLTQLVNRLTRRIKKIQLPAREVAGLSVQSGNWQPITPSSESFLGNGEVLFLNKKGHMGDWNSPDQDKLWLYNLHYFEGLLVESHESRRDLNDSLIKQWIVENPPLQGNGWEPYPLSMRIVNWIKWALNGNSVDDFSELRESLYVQACVLEQSIEYHLLGNHLFLNAKALVFSGVFFESRRAEKWLNKGLDILDSEIIEQVLGDGGNFELSPMYHSLMLYDVLDLINLAGKYSENTLLKPRVETWVSTASKMLSWLESMTHPDGGISFFNDSALGVAPSLFQLSQYASSLGITMPINDKRINLLKESGYVRITQDVHSLIADIAEIGPAYIPGHGHADVLSFEWSVGHDRVFVNSGTSVYGLGSERLLQRQTASHNTVVVDGTDSSEIWSGFRVARRATPSSPVLSCAEDEILLSCSHNGYQRLPGRVTHSRSWLSSHEKLTIKDTLLGDYKDASAYFYLHPDVEIKSHKDTRICILLPSNVQVEIELSGGDVRLIDSCWHPEFGVSIPNKCIVFSFTCNEAAMTATVTSR